MSMLIVRSKAISEQTQQLVTKLSHLTHLDFVSNFQDAGISYDKTQPELIFAQDWINEENAFDFCTRLRLVKGDDATPFIIFTTAENKKDRIKTFQVGGDEYVSDLDPDFVKAVVEHILAHTKIRQQLSKEKDQASHLVIEAMKASSELGNVINFIERCQRFESFEEIANEITQFCLSNSLNTVVAITEGDQWIYQSSSGKATQLEQDLMRSIHQQGRFVDFGVRTQMNWSSIALLIKNMPIREPERYGRIKDLLPTLLSSANVRIHAMYEEQRIKEQTRLMTRSIEKLQPSLEAVIQAMNHDGKEHRNKLSEFLQTIILTLPKLGLEEDQEDFIVFSIESLINQADLQAEKTKTHQETLHTTNKVLLNLLDKQMEIQALMEQPLEISGKPNDSGDELFELF